MSKAMKALQERCGVAPDGAFGPNTARAISRHYELSPERAAHLLGQSAHESGYFKLTEENLNYSEGALNRVLVVTLVKAKKTHLSMRVIRKRSPTTFTWMNIGQKVALLEMLKKMTAGHSEAEDFYNAQAVQTTESLHPKCGCLM